MKTKKLLTFPHIKDEYFREKLEKEIIKYEPKLWSEAVLSARDEKTLDKIGGK